jgi:hypothetical protein
VTGIQTAHNSQVHFRFVILPPHVPWLSIARAGPRPPIVGSIAGLLTANVVVFVSIRAGAASLGRTVLSLPQRLALQP